MSIAKIDVMYRKSPSESLRVLVTLQSDRGLFLFLGEITASRETKGCRGVTYGEITVSRETKGTTFAPVPFYKRQD